MTVGWVLWPVALAGLLVVGCGGGADAQAIKDLTGGDYELLVKDAAALETAELLAHVEKLEAIYELGSSGEGGGLKPEQSFSLYSAPITIQIENGVEVPEGGYKALFRTMSYPVCTLSLVGPQVAMGAAHCFRYRMTKVDFEKVGSKGRCYRHPSWVDGPRNDLALCGFDKPVKIANGFESVAKRQVPRINSDITMLGMGCTQQGKEEPYILRSGRGKVSAAPPGRQDIDGVVYVTSNVARGQPALCAGDSGGPSMVFEGGADDKRQIVGINSHVLVDGSMRYSYLTSTGAAENANFIEQWVRRYKYQVCGINAASHEAPCLGF